MEMALETWSVVVLLACAVHTPLCLEALRADELLLLRCVAMQNSGFCGSEVTNNARNQTKPIIFPITSTLLTRDKRQVRPDHPQRRSLAPIMKLE